MNDLKNANILILGYGREGKSSHSFFAQKYPHTRISIADFETVQPVNSPVQHIYSGAHYLKNLKDFDVVVKSPGIPTKFPEIQEFIKAGGKLASHINLFFENCRGKTIGVTGSKGKSTTASLIAQILKTHFDDVRLAGNIGLPALDTLPDSSEETIFVLELSSFQLELIKYSPHVAVFLDIFPGHLDKHSSYEDYILAKKNLVAYQTINDIVIYSPDHKEVKKIKDDFKGRIYTFSRTQKSTDCFIENEKIIVSKEEIMTVDEVPLLGKGNLENILASVLTANILHVPREKIKEAVSVFKTLEHRLELVAEKRGVIYYNDSIASVPEAAIHAIHALRGKVQTLIVGGADRNYDFSQLGKTISESSIENLILFPVTGRKIRKSVMKSNPNSTIKSIEVNSMKEAVKKAREQTKVGKICLLAPGSPSFGLFKDFEDRGTQFKEEIDKLS